MMKKLLLTGILLASTCALYAEENDFQYPADSGIWYTVINTDEVRTKAGSADYTETPAQFTYGNEVSGEITIPETVVYNGQNYTVVEIGEYGFSNGLTSITLPSTLRKINDCAFYKTSLTSVDIPESVTSIGAHAFQDCGSLQSVTLHEGLSSIGAFAFMKCKALTQIELPVSLDAIGSMAFAETGLNKVTSLNECPPAVSAGTFSKSPAITLYVPVQSLTSYKNQWKNQVAEIEPIPVPAESVSFDRNAMIVYVGGTHMPLHATAYPASTTDKIVWSIEPDEGIVSLEDGLVEGKKAGEAVIKVTCGNFEDTCIVTVKDLKAPESLYIDLPSTNIYVGDSYQFTATITPEKPNAVYNWSISNEEIADIDGATGMLTAKAEGGLVVYAETENLKGAREIYIHSVPAENIDLDTFTVTLKPFDTYQLKTQVNPANTTDKTLVWKSSDETVAVVNNGQITALAEGQATITVSCGPLAPNACDVIVEAVPEPEPDPETEPETSTVEQLLLNESKVSVNVNTPYELKASILPLSSVETPIQWISDSPEIAKVEDGVITGLKPGNALITAICENAYAVCNVTVLNPAKGLSLNRSLVKLEIGKIEGLFVKIDPINSTDTKITWTSSNPAVAEVNANGVVQGISEGEAVIAATCGDITAECTVTVEAAPTTGVDMVTATEEGLYEVYSTNGIHVMTTKDRRNLHNLPAGIYIINGTKTLIK